MSDPFTGAAYFRPDQFFCDADVCVVSLAAPGCAAGKPFAPFGSNAANASNTDGPVVSCGGVALVERQTRHSAHHLRREGTIPCGSSSMTARKSAPKMMR